MTPPDQSAVELPGRRFNRPITLFHRLEYAAVVSLLWIFKLIGLDASSALAGKFCRIIGPMITSVTSRGKNNLKNAFPDWTDAEIATTLKGVWENLGRTAAEYAHLEKIANEDFHKRVTVDGEDIVRPILEPGGRVIFVSGHFANWEVMPLTLHQQGADYSLIYRAVNNPLLDQLIIERRAKVMSRRQIPKGAHGARAFVDALKSGKSIALLVDQKLNDGISAPFMGRAAMTTDVPARLSLKFGIPLIPVQIQRTRGANFHITIKKPISVERTGDTRADTLALTTLMNEAIESDVRENPSQWLWFHRRWKMPSKMRTED